MNSTTVKTNAFGRRIPTYEDMLESPAGNSIRSRLAEVLCELGDNSLDYKFADKLISLAKAAPEQSMFERGAHCYIKRKNILPNIPPKLVARAYQEFCQINPCVRGKTLLDYGCGDGRVGAHFAAEGHHVNLADVYQNPNVAKTGLPFTLLPKEGKIPLSGQFDTTLLLTVLHHSNNPAGTLEQAVKCTKSGGRVIVIESVYGISHYDAEAVHEDTLKLKHLTEDQQWVQAFFFDRFYNNVITDPKLEVNTPGNYLKPREWTKLFEKAGLAQLERKHLGIDVPIVPEYHVLYVLEKV